MDRIAIALVTLAVLGAAGVARQYQALAEREREVASGERAWAAAERDAAALQRLPRDREPLAPATAALAAFARDVEITGIPFRAVVRSGGKQAPGIELGSVRSEPVQIQLESTASPDAAVPWLMMLSDIHPVLLTEAVVDGPTLSLRGVVLGR